MPAGWLNFIPQSVLSFASTQATRSSGSARNVAAVQVSPFSGASNFVVILRPAETKHNFQGSVGFGFRF
jgi:hypothetical protein